MSGHDLDRTCSQHVVQKIIFQFYARHLVCGPAWVMFPLQTLRMFAPIESRFQLGKQETDCVIIRFIAIYLPRKGLSGFCWKPGLTRDLESFSRAFPSIFRPPPPIPHHIWFLYCGNGIGGQLKCVRRDRS